MSDIAIRVENLGKQFKIGTQQASYRTFRDAIVDTVAAPMRRTAALLRGNATGASDLNQTFWALKDVNFEVKEGEVIGIIGRNGAGKSTLLKILSRITEPSEGRITIHGRVGSLLEVGTGFHPELTGRENIYLNGAILGMSRRDIDLRFDEIVDFAEVEQFIDTPVKHYSSGMYMRLAFAVAAHMEPEVLIVDEVLAVGDAAFQKKCLGKMNEVAKRGRTVLFVSHNMGAIQNLCNRGIILDKGSISYEGSGVQAVGYYNRAISTVNGNYSSPHILYEGTLENQNVAITKIEVFDELLNPKPTVEIWDDVTFRFTVESQQHIERGAVSFIITTLEGQSVLTLSTQPDSTLAFPIVPGKQMVDCKISQLPFAAGEYYMTAAIAIPYIEWLWYRAELCTLLVHPRDVYQSGLTPSVDRSLVAVQHQWSKVHAS